MANGFDPQDDSDGGPVYVSATGNDANNGTEAMPYLTLTKAVEKAKAGLDEAGGTVYVDGELSETSENPDSTSIFRITDTGKNGVTISGTGSGAALKRINSTRRRILYLGPDTRLTLENITITGGYAENGGGIYVDSGELILGSGSVITGNTASSGSASGGGGVVVEYGKLTMLDGALISNNKTSQHCGGGVYLLSSEFTMEEGALTNNTAGSSGGGLYLNIRSKAVLKDGAEISENITHQAGGGVAVTGQSELILETGSRIMENTATIVIDVDISSIYSEAGGVAIADSSLILKGGEISGNKAPDGLGGGVSLYGDSTFTMQRGRIAGNIAATNGGGVYLTTGTSFTMEDGSIEKNSAAYGGGIYINPNAQTFTMTGGTIYGNDDPVNGNTATTGNGVGHAVRDRRISPVVTIDTTIHQYPLP
jgi:hypothetical protein